MFLFLGKLRVKNKTGHPQEYRWNMCYLFLGMEHVLSVFGGSGPLEISDRWQIGQINGHGTDGGE